MNGRILLDRKILDWEWWSDVNTTRVFIYILLRANWKDKKWKGQIINRGSFVTSLATMAAETSLTINEVRTCLKHLLNTGEITKQTTNKNTVIIVVNYDLYQTLSQSDNKQSTNKAQPINKLLTTNEIREESIIRKKGNNIYTTSFEAAWKAYPRKDEKKNTYNAYCARLNEGYSEEELHSAVMAYADYCERNHTEKRYIKQGKTFFGINLPFVDFIQKVQTVEEQASEKDEEERNPIAEMSDEEWMNMSDDEFARIYGD